MATDVAPRRIAKAAPPGPGGRGIRGDLPAFRADRLGFLERNARRHGDLYAIRFYHRRLWVLSHPDLIEEVLVTKNRSFIKHFALRRSRETLGNGLLTSEGDFWRRQRKLAQPAFHRDRIGGYARIMVEEAEAVGRGWSDGQVLDIQEQMMQVTLRIVARCLFGADVSAESIECSRAMETLMLAFDGRVGRLIPPPRWLPLPSNLRFRRALGALDRVLLEMVARRRAAGDHPGDLLSMLLHARDEDDGSRMDDRQLRDELMTLFLAGHETTANTLAWTWLLLARNSEAEAKLHAEIDEVLGDRPPSLDDLPRLPYCEQVITEALRVYPTVWLVGREATEPVEIGGYRAPVGTTMYMSQWVVHRDPRLYDDPESFRPERWAGGDLQRRLSRYAYFPFGGGPRLCIGDGFARSEAVLLLAAFARRFRVRIDPGAEVRLLPTMTLRPERGIPATLESRHSMNYS